MNTLDQRLIFFLNDSAVQGHTIGVHQYRLYRDTASGISTVDIFRGNFFYDGGVSVTLDLTDIIKSDGYVLKSDQFEGVYTESTHLFDIYGLEVTWSDGGTTTISKRWIAKVHAYPNKQISPFNAWTIESNPDTIWFRKNVVPMLQGFVPSTSLQHGGESMLVPHYPMYSDEQYQADNECPFALSLKFGSQATQTTLTFEVGPERFDGIYELGSSRTITKGASSTAFYGNIGNVASWGDEDFTPTTNGNLYITDRQYVIDASSGGWDDMAPAEYQDFSPFCFVRYSSMDRSYSETFRYAFVYINNSKGKSCDKITANMLQSLDTSFVLYAKVPYPTAGSDDQKKLVRPANNDVEYYVGDDAVWVSTYKHKVAVLDACPKRYYLFWQDRYGSFQCQAFNEYAKYSESFQRTESQNYQNQRRNINIQAQSKWKLNSGWISEELYPYYESIYTSQVLILFDTQLNDRFNVLVSGDYEEKTFRNQKKLINMNLDLTLNQKQEFVY